MRGSDPPSPQTLLGFLVCRLRREFQLAVHLIEQVLRFLSVTCHVKFIGLLRRLNLIEGLQAEPLSSGEIGVARTRDIGLGRLRDGSASNYKQRAKQSCEDPWFHHGSRLYGAFCHCAMRRVLVCLKKYRTERQVMQ